MKYNNELSRLVINNIFEIERSILVLDEIELTIQKEISDLVHGKIRNKIDLAKDSAFELHKEKGLLYFSDICWEKESEPFAFYDLCTSSESDEYKGDIEEPRWLSFACGYSASAYINIGFNIHYKNIDLRKSDFRKRLQEQYLKHERLQELGFRLSSNGLYIIYDFTLDKALLAEGYPNDFDLSLQPVELSIDALLEAHSDFCKIASSFEQ